MDIPQPYKNAGICNLVAGVFNIALGGIWSLSLLASLVGICLMPVTLIAMGIGAWQCWVGYRMFSGERVQSGTAAIIGGITGLLMLGFPAAALSAGAFMLAGDPTAKDYLEG